MEAALRLGHLEFDRAEPARGGRRPQPPLQLRNGRPPGRVLVEAGGDGAEQGLRDAVQLGRLMGGPVEQCVGRAGAEGRDAGGRVGEHGAEGEHIAGGGEFGPGRLLGRHETGRPDDLALRGEHRAVDGPADAEVDDSGPVEGEQDVGRLEVAVDQSRAVDGGQRLGQARAEHPQGGLGHGPVCLDGVGERRPGDVRGGQPGLRPLGVGVHDGRGEGAADRACRIHLRLEAPAEVGVGGQFGPYDLDGDGTAAGRCGQHDAAHAARAEFPDHSVRPDVRGGGVGLGGRRGHRGSLRKA